MNDQGPQLIKFDAAMRALAEAQSIDEVKEIRDQAEAIRAYTKQRDGGLTMQNQAAAIKLRAERRLGELLADQEMNPGVLKQGPELPLSNDSTTGRPPTLAEQGITRDQSSDWQAIAELPEPDFESYIARAEAEGEELTTAGLVKEIRRRRKKDVQAAYDAAAQDAVETAQVLDSVQPFAAMREEDLQYMTEFQRAHARLGHLVHDLLQFDLGRVVWLADATDRLVIDTGVRQLQDYIHAATSALEAGERNG